MPFGVVRGIDRHCGVEAAHAPGAVHKSCRFRLAEHELV